MGNTDRMIEEWVCRLGVWDIKNPLGLKRFTETLRELVKDNFTPAPCKSAVEVAEQLAASCMVYYTGMQKNLDTGEKQAVDLFEFCKEEATRLIEAYAASQRPKPCESAVECAESYLRIMGIDSCDHKHKLGYLTTRLEAYAAKRVAEALERAAQHLETYYSLSVEGAASTIRSLKPAAPNQDGGAM